MDAEVLDQVAELLARELGEDENLDVLERRLTRQLRDVGQRALQKNLEGKKGATKGLDSAAGAGETPGSSPTGERPS